MPIVFTKLSGDWRHIIEDYITDPGNAIDGAGVTGTVTVTPVLGQGRHAPKGWPSNSIFYTLQTLDLRVYRGLLRDQNMDEDIRVVTQIDDFPVAWRAKFKLTYKGKPIPLHDVVFGPDEIVAGEISLSSLIATQTVPPEYEGSYLELLRAIERAELAVADAEAAADLAHDFSALAVLAAANAGRIMGTGSPEGVKDAPVGTIYVNTANGELWRKATIEGTRFGWSPLGESELEGDYETVWAHTTEKGSRLPLGYREDGRLDDFARTIWREDVSQVFHSEDEDSEFGHVITSPEGHVLLGFKKDGQIVAPGLQASGGEGIPAWERWRHPSGSLAPVHAEMTKIVGWGSSSLAYMAADFAREAQEVGATYDDRAKGGERIQMIAGRQGSVRLQFNQATIPASGPVTLTEVEGLSAASFLGANGTIGGVQGTLTNSGGAFVFTRTTAGDPIEVSAPEFTPTGVNGLRGDVTIIAAGKNNAPDADAVERVCSGTDAMVDYLTPMFPRFVVMGHHIDGTWGVGEARYNNVLAINAYLKDKYGEFYFDVLALISSPDIWDITGITPIPTDFDHQAQLRLAPSLRRDGAHLNVTTSTAVAAQVMDHMRSLNWF